MADSELPPILIEAIDSANEQRLRITLEKLCATIPEALRVASEELLATPTATQPSTEGGSSANAITLDQDEDNAQNSNSGNLKRKRAELGTRRYAVCQDCETEFDITKNGPTSCRFHLEMLVKNDDAPIWFDVRRRGWGNMDNEEGQARFPSGFYWECCEKPIKHPGCEITAHTAKPAPIRKANATTTKRMKETPKPTIAATPNPVDFRPIGISAHTPVLDPYPGTVLGPPPPGLGQYLQTVSGPYHGMALGPYFETVIAQPTFPNSRWDETTQSWVLVV
ncbi:hypothetical protein BDV95DRAFT_540627 [Massariosphaeria phaeospora]|uniref:C2H2-type domain-containing protein n=1 Tax=Massariosphaeria phaeospora TaxID=100035 RepID=A0A7C8I8R1_9PLEO|nr:hypothetical protein BDV95DRAFT_540627 [Massariosphaeria phaeospora]